MRQTYVPLLSLALAVALFASESSEVFAQIDDAYISYRYALNLVNGHGLVFNVGEYVEGYTNLLWTLLVAGGLWLGWSAEATGHWLGFAAGCTLLAGCCRYSHLTLPTRAKWLSAAAPLILLASNSFACWTASGLETPLFSAFIVWALVAQLEGRTTPLVALCVLATLTRPDGVLVALVLLNRDLVAQTITERRIPITFSVWARPLSYAAAVLLLTALRWAYYGDIVPNTFHAKVGGIPAEAGVAYIWRFLSDGVLFLLIPAVFARNRDLIPGLLHVAIVFIYVVLVGGDVFPHGRFLLPVLPAIVTTCLVGIAALMDRNRAIGAAALVCVPAMALWSLFIGTAPMRGFAGAFSEPHLALDKRAASRQFNYLPDHVVRRQADQIRSASPPIDLVATVAIGRLGYHSQVAILDLVGLIDPVISGSHSGQNYSDWYVPGHQRSNADYVFYRDPDLIRIPKRGTRTYSLPAVGDLWKDARLDQLYYWDRDFKAYRRRIPGPR